MVPSCGWQVTTRVPTDGLRCRECGGLVELMIERPDPEPIQEPFQLKSINEYIAQVQYTVPKLENMSEELLDQLTRQYMSKEYGDFIINESGKVDIKRVDSLHSEDITQRAAVAILSVEELKDIYEYIKKLKHENKTRKDIMHSDRWNANF
jgi:hypothetical protein